MARTEQGTLDQILSLLDPGASLAERHLWAIRLITWIRGRSKPLDPDAVLARLEHVIGRFEVDPELAARLAQWWRVFALTIEATPLLADYGFAPRTAFVSELGHRLRRKLLPSTPETVNLAELFELMFEPEDRRWLLRLESGTLARLMALLAPQPETPSPSGEPSAAASLTGLWQSHLLDALLFSVGQIAATGFAPEIRMRMSREARASRCFTDLAPLLEQLQQLWATQPLDSPHLSRAIIEFRGCLEACRQAASTVYAHLGENGISVGIVFRLRQLRARVLRIRHLLDALLAADSARAGARLLAHFTEVSRDRSSVRALVASNSTLLATWVTERSAETGEHYIARDRREYWQMFAAAAGGGAVLSVTTAIKFVVVGLGLSIFWGGFWAGVNYALSFLLIYLLHFTVATKQPAMTAPALAAKLRDIRQLHGKERRHAAETDFLDETVHLVRTQLVGVAGNLLLVFPCVVLLDLVLRGVFQHDVIDVPHAEQTLAGLSLLGATPIYAVLTGGLLFASSIIAGWVENWFVLQRLDSAVRWNPLINRWLGHARADRWAAWLRKHISPMTSNISLGLMLGIVPAIAAFFGISLEVRHVTLSTGQIAAAMMALGPSSLATPAFWWAIAGALVTGLLNLSVSFYLAFKVAARAQSLHRIELVRLRRGLWQRLIHTPGAFFMPPRGADTPPKTSGLHPVQEPSLTPEGMMPEPEIDTTIEPIADSAANTDTPSPDTGSTKGRPVDMPHRTE